VLAVITRRFRIYRTSRLGAAYVFALVALIAVANLRASQVSAELAPTLAKLDSTIAAYAKSVEANGGGPTPLAVALATERRDLALQVTHRINFWNRLNAAFSLAFLLAIVLGVVRFVQEVIIGVGDEGEQSTLRLRGK
jgi:hypothetical protein